MSYSVTTCYRFLSLEPEAVENLKSTLEHFAEATGLRGFCLIGREGVNLTVAGAALTVGEFKILLARTLQVENLAFKNAIAERPPFRVFRVKVREEIVTLGRPDLVPEAQDTTHLKPSAWREALKDPEAIVLDTRNRFEVDLGRFHGAVDFNLEEFGEFPQALREAAWPKDKPVLMYCTGGIRCEKAILEMHEQGFTNVHQLEGGILNYLAEYPDDAYEGECFVFDYRVAVDQKLKPSTRFDLCHHCGQPSELTLTCVQCKETAPVCPRCRREGINTCSKNCRHHLAIGSNSRRPPRN